MKKIKEFQKNIMQGYVNIIPKLGFIAFFFMSSYLFSVTSGIQLKIKDLKGTNSFTETFTKADLSSNQKDITVEALACYNSDLNITLNYELKVTVTSPDWNQVNQVVTSPRDRLTGPAGDKSHSFSGLDFSKKGIYHIKVEYIEYDGDNIYSVTSREFKYTTVELKPTGTGQCTLNTAKLNLPELTAPSEGSVLDGRRQFVWNTTKSYQFSEGCKAAISYEVIVCEDSVEPSCPSIETDGSINDTRIVARKEISKPAHPSTQSVTLNNDDYVNNKTLSYGGKYKWTVQTTWTYNASSSTVKTVKYNNWVPFYYLNNGLPKITIMSPSNNSKLNIPNLDISYKIDADNAPTINNYRITVFPISENIVVDNNNMIINPLNQSKIVPYRKVVGSDISSKDLSIAEIIKYYQEQGLPDFEFLTIKVAAYIQNGQDSQIVSIPGETRVKLGGGILHGQTGEKQACETSCLTIDAPTLETGSKTTGIAVITIQFQNGKKIVLSKSISNIGEQFVIQNLLEEYMNSLDVGQDLGVTSFDVMDIEQITVKLSSLTNEFRDYTEKADTYSDSNGNSQSTVDSEVISSLKNISITVKNAADGKEVPEALINLLSVTTTGKVIMRTSVLPEGRPIPTNNSGKVVLNDLDIEPNQDYIIEVSEDKYKTFRTEPLKGKDLKNHTITLEPIAHTAVTGVVRKSGNIGSPIADAEVSLKIVCGEHLLNQCIDVSRVLKTTTDNEGNFSFPDVASNYIYKLSVKHLDGQLISKVNEDRYSSGQPDHTIDLGSAQNHYYEIRLNTNLFKISGTVYHDSHSITDPLGSPVVEATISILDEGGKGEYSWQTFTGQDGGYKFELPYRATPYRLIVEAPRKKTEEKSFHVKPNLKLEKIILQDVLSTLTVKLEKSNEQALNNYTLKLIPTVEQYREEHTFNKSCSLTSGASKEVSGINAFCTDEGVFQNIPVVSNVEYQISVALNNPSDQERYIVEDFSYRTNDSLQQSIIIPVASIIKLPGVVFEEFNKTALGQVAVKSLNVEKFVTKTDTQGKFIIPVPSIVDVQLELEFSKTIYKQDKRERDLANSFAPTVVRIPSSDLDSYLTYGGDLIVYLRNEVLKKSAELRYEYERKLKEIFIGAYINDPNSIEYHYNQLLSVDAFVNDTIGKQVSDIINDNQQVGVPSLIQEVLPVDSRGDIDYIADGYSEDLSVELYSSSLADLPDTNEIQQDDKGNFPTYELVTWVTKENNLEKKEYDFKETDFTLTPKDGSMNELIQENINNIVDLKDELKLIVIDFLNRIEGTAEHGIQLGGIINVVKSIKDIADGEFKVSADNLLELVSELQEAYEFINHFKEEMAKFKKSAEIELFNSYTNLLGCLNRFDRAIYQVTQYIPEKFREHQENISKAYNKHYTEGLDVAYKSIDILRQEIKDRFTMANSSLKQSDYDTLLEIFKSKKQIAKVIHQNARIRFSIWKQGYIQYGSIQLTDNLLKKYASKSLYNTWNKFAKFIQFAFSLKNNDLSIEAFVRGLWARYLVPYFEDHRDMILASNTQLRNKILGPFADIAIELYKVYDFVEIINREITKILNGVLKVQKVFGVGGNRGGILGKIDLGIFNMKNIEYVNDEKGKRVRFQLNFRNFEESESIETTTIDETGNLEHSIATTISKTDVIGIDQIENLGGILTVEEVKEAPYISLNLNQIMDKIRKNYPELASKTQNENSFILEKIEMLSKMLSPNITDNLRNAVASEQGEIMSDQLVGLYSFIGGWNKDTETLSRTNMLKFIQSALTAPAPTSCDNQDCQVNFSLFQTNNIFEVFGSLYEGYSYSTKDSKNIIIQNIHNILVGKSELYKEYNNVVENFKKIDFSNLFPENSLWGKVLNSNQSITEDDRKNLKNQLNVQSNNIKDITVQKVLDVISNNLIQPLLAKTLKIASIAAEIVSEAGNLNGVFQGEAIFSCGGCMSKVLTYVEALSDNLEFKGISIFIRNHLNFIFEDFFRDESDIDTIDKVAKGEIKEDNFVKQLGINLGKKFIGYLSNRFEGSSILDFLNTCIAEPYPELDVGQCVKSFAKQWFPKVVSSGDTSSGDASSGDASSGDASTSSTPAQDSNKLVDTLKNNELVNTLKENLLKGNFDLTEQWKKILPPILVHYLNEVLKKKKFSFTLLKTTLTFDKFFLNQPNPNSTLLSLDVKPNVEFNEDSFLSKAIHLTSIVAPTVKISSDTIDPQEPWILNFDSKKKFKLGNALQVSLNTMTMDFRKGKRELEAEKINFYLPKLTADPLEANVAFDYSDGWYLKNFTITGTDGQRIVLWDRPSHCSQQTTENMSDNCKRPNDNSKFKIAIGSLGYQKDSDGEGIFSITEALINIKALNIEDVTVTFKVTTGGKITDLSLGGLELNFSKKFTVEVEEISYQQEPEDEPEKKWEFKIINAKLHFKDVLKDFKNINFTLSYYKNLQDSKDILEFEGGFTKEVDRKYDLAGFKYNLKELTFEAGNTGPSFSFCLGLKGQLDMNALSALVEFEVSPSNINLCYINKDLTITFSEIKVETTDKSKVDVTGSMLRTEEAFGGSFNVTFKEKSDTTFRGAFKNYEKDSNGYKEGDWEVTFGGGGFSLGSGLEFTDFTGTFRKKNGKFGLTATADMQNKTFEGTFTVGYQPDDHFVLEASNLTLAGGLITDAAASIRVEKESIKNTNETETSMTGQVSATFKELGNTIRGAGILYYRTDGAFGIGLLGRYSTSMGAKSLSVAGGLVYGKKFDLARHGGDFFITNINGTFPKLQYLKPVMPGVLNGGKPFILGEGSYSQLIFIGPIPVYVGGVIGFFVYNGKNLDEQDSKAYGMLVGAHATVDLWIIRVSVSIDIGYGKKSQHLPSLLDRPVASSGNILETNSSGVATMYVGVLEARGCIYLAFKKICKSVKKSYVKKSGNGVQKQQTHQTEGVRTTIEEKDENGNYVSVATENDEGSTENRRISLYISAKDKYNRDKDNKKLTVRFNNESILKFQENLKINDQNLIDYDITLSEDQQTIKLTMSANELKQSEGKVLTTTIQGDNYQSNELICTIKVGERDEESYQHNLCQIYLEEDYISHQEEMILVGDNRYPVVFNMSVDKNEIQQYETAMQEVNEALKGYFWYNVKLDYYKQFHSGQPNRDSKVSVDLWNAEEQANNADNRSKTIDLHEGSYQAELKHPLFKTISKKFVVSNDASSREVDLSLNAFKPHLINNVSQDLYSEPLNRTIQGKISLNDQAETVLPNYKVYLYAGKQGEDLSNQTRISTLTTNAYGNFSSSVDINEWRKKYGEWTNFYLRVNGYTQIIPGSINVNRYRSKEIVFSAQAFAKLQAQNPLDKNIILEKSLSNFSLRVKVVANLSDEDPSLQRYGLYSRVQGLEGAIVELTNDETGESVISFTDSRGDADFDGIDDRSRYNVSIKKPGYASKTLTRVSYQNPPRQQKLKFIGYEFTGTLDNLKELPFPDALRVLTSENKRADSEEIKQSVANLNILDICDNLKVALKSQFEEGFSQYQDVNCDPSSSMAHFKLSKLTNGTHLVNLFYKNPLSAPYAIETPVLQITCNGSAKECILNTYNASNVFKKCRSGSYNCISVDPSITSSEIKLVDRETRYAIDSGILVGFKDANNNIHERVANEHGAITKFGFKGSKYKLVGLEDIKTHTSSNSISIGQGLTTVEVLKGAKVNLTVKYNDKPVPYATVRINTDSYVDYDLAKPLKEDGTNTFFIPDILYAYGNQLKFIVTNFNKDGENSFYEYTYEGSLSPTKRNDVTINIEGEANNKTIKEKEYLIFSGSIAFKSRTQKNKFLSEYRFSIIDLEGNHIIKEAKILEDKQKDTQSTLDYSFTVYEHDIHGPQWATFHDKIKEMDGDYSVYFYKDSQ